MDHSCGDLVSHDNNFQIFAFGEAVAVSRQVAAGIGQYRSTLTAGEYESFQKVIHAD